MKKIIFIILLLSLNAFAQYEFEVKNASEKFDIKINVAKCEDGFCEGKTTYTLFEKGKETLFQKFEIENTSIWLDEDREKEDGSAGLEDEQDVLIFDDFNFDGVEDLALNNGKKGGYRVPTYRIYLFSKSKNKFIFSESLNRLAQEGHIGIFDVDKEKKRLVTLSKSGCCISKLRAYEVNRDQPVKVYEATTVVRNKGKDVKITIREFIKGKWKTSVIQNK